MPKVSETKGTAFDGRKTGYVPPKKLSISRKLKLQSKHVKNLDPITYEVVRHALWHVNEEHGATIQRLSGSPVAMYALDLNPSILTEDGEFVYFGPYMQYMSGVTDTQVKWILEYRSDNPGIRDGDMFLANDPWVGAAHQQDVMLICPVFWKDELFCWVTNCLHQYDLGGILRLGKGRVRRRYLHSAGENHRAQRNPARHRGAVPPFIAQARSGRAGFSRPARRQYHRSRSRSSADTSVRAGGRQGRHEAHHR